MGAEAERAAGSDGRCPAQQALAGAVGDVLGPRAAVLVTPDELPTVLRAALEARGYTITPRVPEPADEPTEADPPSCVALDEHVNTLRFFVSSVRKFHGECEVPCRSGCAMDVDAAEAAACVLDEIVRLRTLVGGRSAAPTRDEVAAAIENGAWGEISNRAVETATDAVVALLSRSAAEPPEDQQERVRVELTPDDLDGGYVAECVSLPGCVSQGDTVPEALVNLADAYAAITGVAAEPNEEAGDGG